MDDNGIELHLSSSVSAIGENSVTAIKDGQEFEVKADAVVMAIGVRPETGLAVSAGLEIGETGGIKVNHNYQTSDSNYLAFKLVFEVPTGRILGAQAIGKGVADKRIDVIAAMITMGADLEDLKELELCYSPVFGTAKDVVNLAALVALNVLYGRFKQVHVSEVRGLVESGAYIIDVREEDEYEAGHLIGSHNIPTSQIWDRMNEIPKDIPVYVHCRTSQRSYYALSYLQGCGFTNIVNISGSYLGISLYEYFDDKTTGRAPIVTAYNFE